MQCPREVIHPNRVGGRCTNAKSVSKVTAAVVPVPDRLELSLLCSGYASQAVSSNTLSSEDSMSLRSISVDEASPDTEVASTVAPAMTSSTSTAASSLLSPKAADAASLVSISPGEDTDNTVTATSPSSANATPSREEAPAAENGQSRGECAAVFQASDVR